MTWLSNGASVAACPDDLAPALIHVLAVDLGVDPGKFYEHVKRFVDKQAKTAAAEAGKGTPDAAADEPAAGTGEPTQPGGDTGVGGQSSMADIIPEDWVGEAMT